MSYIKLKVRSGGVYFKQQTDWLEIQFGNLILYPPETKDKKDNAINLYIHPEDSSQKVLSLVRDSSIKGLFSYLMGETGKLSYKDNGEVQRGKKKQGKEKKDNQTKDIKTGIENNPDPQIQKLNATLDKMVQNAICRKISEPFITTFFERRDVHTKDIISPPSVFLQNYSIEQTEPTIRHLEKPLKNIMKTSHLSPGEVHDFFKQSVIKSEQPDYKKAIEYILKHLEIYSRKSNNKEENGTGNLIKQWKIILKENNLNNKEYTALKSNKIRIPEYNKLTPDVIDKLKDDQSFEKQLMEKLNKIMDIKQTNKDKFDGLKPAITKTLKNHFNKKFKNNKVTQGLIKALEKIIDEKPISFKVICLIEEIYKLSDEDSDFATKIQNLTQFQFSSFTNLGQTKAWIDKQYYPVVRGTPAYIACVDFDIYLSESVFGDSNNSDLFSWEDIVNKIKKGPNIARWGEGGIVFIDYSSLDEMGCPYDINEDDKKNMFIEIQALRNAGLKIKKYDWEEDNNTKKQKAKNIDKKVSDNQNTFLANTKGQILKEHSIAVALYGHLFLKSLKFKSSFKSSIEKEMNNFLVYSALLHDIGKISSGFQKYIKSRQAKNNNLKDIPMDAEAFRPKKFEGPFHNEISWAYTANFINFHNNSIRDVVRHSVYWHHPANWSDKDNKVRFENSQLLFEKVKEKLKENIPQLLCDIHGFVDDLLNVFCIDYFKDFERSDCLKKPDEKNIDTTQYPEFFSHKINDVACNAKKQLCLNLLLEADRTVSSWSPEKLKDFLNTWKTYKVSVYKTNKFSIEENLNKKSKEQYNLANEMAGKKLSVCGVDPAGGKTSVSLYWWDKCNNEYPLMIALPRQNQVTGLFESLKEDCKRVYGNQKINMEAVFNGQRQYRNWNIPDSDRDLLISDINILVFDRFLSPYYKRSQSSEFLKMLKSHLILDEFHEFNSLPKMVPSLKEILTIRSWLDSGVKTLMLSGTPEPSLLKLLCIEESSVFKREKLSPRHGHKFGMTIKETSTEQKQDFYHDCLYSFLRVECCQKLFSRFLKKARDKIKLIHSYFTVSDKKELLKKILREHGKDQSTAINDKSVITSKMLQSSYNLSFNKAVVELSQPSMDCQTAGRINRFETKPNSEICFIYNEDSEKFFNESWGAGFKEIHKHWKKHISSFIEEHKNQTVSIRELMESYDDFWNKESNKKSSLEILKKNQEKAIKELNTYIPKRFSGKNKKSSSLNSLFRGESQYLSACVVNDEGQPTDQLHSEDLLNESRNWFIKKIKESLPVCLKSEPKCNKANNINDNEVFEYKKYIKNFGFKAERPLLCSHVDEEIDKCLSYNLRDEDNNSTDHRVYNKKFGLVKKDLLK